MDRLIRSIGDWFVEQGLKISTLWRTSLQARVITSVLVVSVVVVGVLGFALVSIVAQRLLDEKQQVASDEIERARVVVEQELSTRTSETLQARLNIARDTLLDRNGPGETGSNASFAPVLIVPTGIGDEYASSPTDPGIPESLRSFVQQGQVSQQYATLDDGDGRHSVLVIGTPTSTYIPGLELYLIVSLSSEESTLSLVQTLFAAASVVVVMLLILIVWLFSNQVTAPVRQAARIAEQFAEGNLRERMTVDGEDEMARLAVSFNAMAESLSDQIKQLEEYGSLQRQFTSDVSHELRTPLTTVRMAADLIADAENLDPMTRRASELMTDELDRFEMLLSDLLEISRHDAGVAELSAANIDVRQCIDAALTPLTVVAEEADVEIRRFQPDTPVMAEVDSRRVERVLRNLIANAIDHSEGRPVDIRVAAGETAVAFTVTDHGVGLSPGQFDLVFNRFWRADPSRERRTGGTGLGLAIAREDALLHGGQLSAYGEPGVGSCFRLVVPVTPETQITSIPLPLDVVPVPAGRKEQS